MAAELERWRAGELHPVLERESLPSYCLDQRVRVESRSFDAPGSCTPFWRSRISRRTAWTSAPGVSEKPPPGVAPGSPAYETGASLLMLRRRRSAGSSAELEGPSGSRTPLPRVCSSGPHCYGSRTVFVEFGRGRTRTPCPSGHHALSRRGRRLGRVIVHRRQRVIGAAGFAPASSASQTRRPAPGPRPTSSFPESPSGIRRMSEDSHLTPTGGAHALAGRPGASSGSASRLSVLDSHQDPSG